MSVNRPHSTQDQRLGVWETYLRGHTGVMRALERELQESHQLSIAEYDVLLHVYSAPNRRLRLGELACAVLFSTGGLSRLLDRMERAGLVTRERAPGDRRGVYAVLTEEGASRLRAARETHLAGIQRHFSALLREDEIEPVGRFFHRLVKVTTTQRPEGVGADTCDTGDTGDTGAEPLAR